MPWGGCVGLRLFAEAADEHFEQPAEAPHIGRNTSVGWHS